MELATLTARLDELLRTDAYADIDASANGLQVGPTPDATREGDSPEVDRVAFAVDAAQATARAASDRGADLLVTHHGIVWGGLDRVTGTTYDRVTAFTDRGVSLYVSHLPLDGHPAVGNAAQLADGVGLEATEPFGEPEPFGRIGTSSEPLETDALAERVERALPDGERALRTFDFGPDEIERVAILTGSGADFLDDAVAAGADAFVTGEGKQQLYHEAREAGVSVVLGGHYRTEVGGVRALADRVEEWGLDTVWIDHPTGL